MRVVQFAAPTYDEKRHHFLWRFWPALPGWGGMAVLDRSWYGRVLVERVEKFATREQWTRAYDEINDFERTLAAEGMTSSSSSCTSPTRSSSSASRRASDDPLKSWKLTDEDWRNRKQRKQYEAAIEDMLERTDTARRAVAPGRGRLQALGAREGRRDGQRRASRPAMRAHGIDPPTRPVRDLALAVRLARLAFWARVFLRARSFVALALAALRSGQARRRSAVVADRSPGQRAARVARDEPADARRTTTSSAPPMM